MSRLLLADVAPGLHLGLESLDAALRRAQDGGLIGALAVQAVVGLARALAARRGEAAPSPTVGLALALAVALQRRGHVAVDLERVSLDLPAGPGEAPQALVVDRAGWREAVAGSGLVAGPDSAAGASPFVLEGSLLYTRRAWVHQGRLAARLLAHSRRPVAPLQHPDRVTQGLDHLFRPPSGEPTAAGAPLNRQRLAAAQALLSPLLVLTGGPGMGKTWTVRNLLALLLLDQLAGDPTQPALRIALAAPTGKAAARMSESVSQGLDGPWMARLRAVAGSEAVADRVRYVLETLEASTLHRLLGTLPGRGRGFRHHRDEPLPVDVVVVDEASMVDLVMMDRLVDAVPDHARLVLVGDRDQLASVEAGCVLADLCGPTRTDVVRLSAGRAQALAALGLDTAARAPVAGRGGVVHVPETGLWDHVVPLDQTFRFSQDSGIAAFVSACLLPDDAFDAAAATAVLADPGRRDVAVVPHGSGGTLEPGLARLLVDGEGVGPSRLAGFRDAYDLLFGGLAASGLPTEQAFHRRVLDLFGQVRILCAHRRGRVGVDGMNPRIAALLERQLPALVRTGTWWAGRPVLVLQNDRTTGLFNGDIGLAVLAGSGAQRRLRVAFPGPDSLPAGDPTAADPGLRLVRYVATARLPHHQTTFAMTIHKSQGSEFDHAVVVLPEGSSRILTRELLYTGITRARRRATVVGDRQVLQDALKERVQRWSGLGPALWDGPVG